MRRSYIREKKYQCGDAYMTVGVYAVTDQEHRQRGKCSPPGYFPLRYSIPDQAASA